MPTLATEERAVYTQENLHTALPRTQPDGENGSECQPKQPQVENPKYAMRTWLLRLGFIGDEFATARDILTKNLEGDTAFRHGRAA